MDEAQRTARKSGIGASEAAPIVLGKDRFGRTAVDVYSAKVLDPREYSTQAMSRGNFLEGGVLAWYEAETGEKIARRNVTLRSPTHEWMLATPDGLTVSDRVVEAKTARHRDGWGEPGTDQIPLEYLIQTHHQMIVTELRVADVPVLFGGLEFALYRVEFDAELAEMIVRETGAFWRDHVLARVPPAPRSGSDCEILYRRDNGAIQVATPEIAEMCRVLADMRQQLGILESQETELLDAIKAAMGEAAFLVGDGGEKLATWKSNKDSAVFDKNRFAADHPDLVSQYQRVQPGARVFRLNVKPQQETIAHERIERIAG